MTLLLISANVSGRPGTMTTPTDPPEVSYQTSVVEHSKGQ